MHMSCGLQYATPFDSYKVLYWNLCRDKVDVTKGEQQIQALAVGKLFKTTDIPCTELQSSCHESEVWCVWQIAKRCRDT